jgi:RNA polymerase sigma-70 factor (ECF subfamily)
MIYRFGKENFITYIKNLYPPNLILSAVKHSTDFSIQGFRKGEPADFKYIFNLFHNLIYIYSLNLLRDEPEAKDIASESFIKLWERRGGFENLDKIKAFLYITARNSCISRLRSRKIKSRSEEELRYLSALLPETDPAFIDAAVFDRLYAEIEGLPPRCQEIVKLILYHDLGTAAIAGRLEMSEVNVRNRKAEAVKLLRPVFLKKLLRE